VLPRPQPSDTELLATLGVDLEAVHARVQEAFGEEAYFETVQRVQHRPTQAVAHAPLVDTDPSPLVCVRAWRFAYDEAVARDQEIGPEHLLLGVLAEASNPVDTDLARERRQRSLLGLPDRGPHPVRLLVEARGTTLDRLRTAVLEELDRAH
jgi:Clp amino terminal domain, pathogenicity island component